LYYFGARYYEPRVSVWLSADPILEKHVYNPISLNLYVYGHQNPVKLLDPDGKDVYLFVWFSAAGETGHAGVAVDNYKLDQAGKPVKDGTFTYYDLWPFAPLGKTEMQNGVKPDYSTGVKINSIEDLKGNDPTGNRAGKVSAEGRAADGIVQIPASYDSTMKAKSKAETDIKASKQYNACYNNCSTFAQGVLNAALNKGIDARQTVKPNWTMKNVLGYKEADVVAPNNLYNAAVLGIKDMTLIKGPASVESKPYLEYFGK